MFSQPNLIAKAISRRHHFADVARLSDALSFRMLEAVLLALNEVAGDLPDDESATLRRALARLTPPKQ